MVVGHTGRISVRGNREHRPVGQAPMAAEEVTVAEVLKKAGYVTGAFGKWRLGYPGSHGDPLHRHRPRITSRPIRPNRTTSQSATPTWLSG